ncbi:membrane-bound lytic murein transglycosylase D [Rhabdobacter roseus]|uniref:Membrane-bound lytic murein transglycosylase D n=1 Tax=Rhabdobacter roseus TaxID=1655419 RepID=A0A840TH42_9BACT|nr:LysM peptidoglycan-binding domain-containing protein [Rhabdobacter roseus]MBB5282561.1 membrane-bound lytic murein transglycosylase D [Rhabdobacter roseus]
MKTVKRTLWLTAITVGLWNVPAQAQATPQQEEVDYETDTVGLAMDFVPEIEKPSVVVPGELIKTRLASLQKEIPLVYHPDSHKFVEYFINIKPHFTRRMLEHKNLYFPIYEKAFAKHGLPDELKYLSMIESGLDPRIISYAGAGGLWQFMRPTGREFGLRQDAYIDERFDPEKSTEAACRYLRQLHKIFGDWELALASYNAGPGNVRRAMRRSGGDTFWSVYPALPKQTRHYVPQFVAMLYMMHYAEDHGIVAENPEYLTVTDTIHVNGYLDLTTFSALSSVSMEDLRKLNPQLINTVLPDYTRDFVLKVPAEQFAYMKPMRPAIMDSASKKNGVRVMLASNDYEGDYEYKTKRVTYTVRSGETLSSIANKHRVSVAELKKWNRLKSSRVLRGQRLTIVRQVRVAAPAPVLIAEAKPKTTTAPVATTTEETDDENEELVAEGTPVAEAKPASGKAGAAASSVASATTTKSVNHLVKKGETLTVIARQYGVEISDLKEWNDMEDGRLLAGQKLVIQKQVKGEVLAKSTDTKATAPTVAAQPNYPIKARYHTVQQGDTLWTISQRYGLTVDKIKRNNNIRGNSIKAGMKLLITS